MSYRVNDGLALLGGAPANLLEGRQVDGGGHRFPHDANELFGAQGLRLDGLAHVLAAVIGVLLRRGRQVERGHLLGSHGKP
ncbi:hypothetical protein [Streptomyces noursei]|uniref:hypothetical protein n=1 Tax=Streptomyces noursei TaxID=1971 RepID=UPI0021A2B9A9|nr:hypothetical protein [Streptomyces noursei]UWS77600.1 hypothetical protein N1H47_40655 [Streptomyces noursei]